MNGALTRCSLILILGGPVTIPAPCDSQCDFHAQLEGMEVNKSVADMAANKFKNMLNRSDMKMI